MEAILDLKDSDASIVEKCSQLGALLGVGGPVSERVLLAALDDDTYARNLLTCRRTPVLLGRLLAHPPAPRTPSRLALLGRASAALVKWGRTGFSVVDDDTGRRRMAACLACPNLMEPDEHRALYRAVAGSAQPKVCGVCGCAVARKTRLPSEQCPAEHPEDPTQSRWGEPRQPRS